MRRHAAGTRSFSPRALTDGLHFALMPINPNGCVYCAAPTGSREHPFPAALGGRRVNKGILCHDCNQGFSVLDAALVAQLDVFNGLLGVRSDHRDDPKPATVTDPRSGTTYRVGASGRPELHAPQVLDGDPSGVGKVSMLFTSEEQVQEWLRAQRAKGLHPKMIARSEYQGLRVDPFEVEWTFGGDEAFREVGRIVVNFLAHYFPDLARQEGVALIKQFVLGRGGDHLVEYDMASAQRGLEAPARTFSHRVVLTIDRERRWAIGRLSLFSRYHFSVVLGQVDAEKSETIVVDLDPLAEHAPHDIIVDRRDGVCVELTSPTGATADLMGAATRDLLSAIERRNWVPFADGVLGRLASARALHGEQRADAVADALTSSRQVLVNVLTHIVNGGAARLRAEKVPEDFVATWTALASPSNKPGGVTALTNAVVEQLRWRFARHIAEHLDDVHDAAALHEVLRGGTAIRLGAEVIHELWTAAVDREPE
jgi:hypothetical protein